MEDRLVEFGAIVCGLAEGLRRSQAGMHVAGQLIRCGTAAASNYAEAQNAESRRDFIHKMKVCLKELGETRVWLKLAKRMGLDAADGLEDVLQESTELIRIFARSIQTAQTNEKGGAVGGCGR